MMPSRGPFIPIGTPSGRDTRFLWHSLPVHGGTTREHTSQVVNDGPDSRPGVRWMPGIGAND